MKKLYGIMAAAVLLAAVFVPCLTAETPAADVSVSLTFTRQSGFASNQIAVWVEDSEGNLVKTLFVTKFTGKGGWKKRPNCVPVWLERSDIANAPRKNIDAVTGATPKTGPLSFKWDGSDQNGNRVPSGEYIICVEGTLRDASRVLYTGRIILGGDRQSVELTPEYTGTAADSKEKNMIAAVIAVYHP
ncbi:DUF2271 domain-containing protein [Brucepastera parasyntrophica]|uniref:DUF2271 domain-containing protein n=1 Tax=Brucepastera parasyntrophica TaxID=2880008 RepID=UPI00210BA3B6|nr:DUF2271 domain-containing protein [Brucepastera parasyntrophica]ULQ58960.1 DUF2271 domain-containing protein [Brucepastera parasyntrophica]